MPVVKDDNLQEISRRAIQAPEFKDEDVSTKELALAVFRTENTIGSLISRESGLPDSADSDYNPWDDLTDNEKLDESFLDNAMLADNKDELEAVRKQTLKERSDRETMSKGGAMSFALGFGIGGIADPINLIPVGGAAARTYKTGSSILKAGMVTGSVAAGSTALQEMELHRTQIERTFGESAVNVTASFLLGGALGMTAKQLGDMGVDKKVLDEIEGSMDPESRVNKGENPQFRKDDSAGAARVDDEVQIEGAAIRAAARALPFDPATRTLSSRSQEARKLSNKLIENVYEMEGGQPITGVESLVKIHDGKMYEALEAHYSEYRSLQRELGGTTGAGRVFNRRGMSKSEFNEMVSREVRNPNPNHPAQVQRAANAWNEKLYNPLRDEAIRSNLLPVDIDVTTAARYLNRVWSKQKIAANMPQFVRRVSDWLEEQDANFGGAADDDFDYIAEQIAQRIMGTPDGRLPYDWQLGEGSMGYEMRGTSLRGPLRDRSFNIQDELVEEFLENDIEKLGGRYLSSMAPDIEIARAFENDISLGDALQAVQTDWRNIIDAAETPRQAIRFQKEMDRDIADIAAMRDRIRGVYKVGDYNNIFTRIGRSIRDLNYLRFMGGVVASSVPDVARIFTAEGFVKSFKNGLMPLISNHKAFKVAASEAKRYGVGVDALMGGRAEIIADVADYAQGGTALERGLRAMSDKFGKVNMMDYWTASVKQLHAVTMQTSIMDDLVKGKIDKRLSRLGIDDANAKNILEQVKKHGRKEDGVWIYNARNWDSPELERIWGAALRKESDRVIVVPGQEKPLFMSTEMGKSFMQFRSFMLSSTQRMLIAGIQGQDHNYIGGTLAIISIGMMAYAFKQWDAGRELSDDPKAWLLEGIDRSGSLGMLMEMNNTIEKISNNNHGLRPYLGVTAPSSRFASRSQLEGLLGPTFGSFGETTLKVLAAGSDNKDWNSSDTRALRRLLPYQNLTFLRQGFDKLEEAAK